jgi:hypothetical protein
MVHAVASLYTLALCTGSTFNNDTQETRYVGATSPDLVSGIPFADLVL